MFVQVLQNKLYITYRSNTLQGTLVLFLVLFQSCFMPCLKWHGNIICGLSLIMWIGSIWLHYGPPPTFTWHAWQYLNFESMDVIEFGFINNIHCLGFLLVEMTSHMIAHLVIIRLSCGRSITLLSNHSSNFPLMVTKKHM